MSIDLDNLRNEYIAIVPIFNEEKKAKKVLNSLLSSYPMLRIYVIDDGSTDKTTEIIKEFKDKNIIKLFNNKNYGKGYSMRLALSEITPDKNRIIFFWDGDDELDVKNIHKLIYHYKNEPNCNILFGSRFLVKNPILRIEEIKLPRI